MPEKIPIKQMRQWLDLYESGTAVDVIAHKFRRDVRTINRGIEQARRDRSAERVRTAMMTDAIKQHQERLLNAVGEIMSGLEIGVERFAALTGESQGLDLATLLAEEMPYWELLKQHLPRDPVWDLVGKWKKAVADFADKCTQLRKKTDHLLVTKCRCNIVENDGKPPFLFTRAPEMVYAEVLHRATDNKPRTDINTSLQVDMKSGNIMLPSTTLAIAPGKEEKFARYIKEVLNEISESEEAASLPNEYSAIQSARQKARKAAEDIVLLGMLPGTCRICRKLGL